MASRMRTIVLSLMAGAVFTAAASAQDGDNVLDLSSLFNAADLEGITGEVRSTTGSSDKQATLDALNQRTEQQAPQSATPEASSTFNDSIDQDEPVDEPVVEPPQQKPSQPSGDGLITNSFYDTDLRQALQDMGMSVGRTIISSPDVSGFITCELENATFDEALHLLLAGTGYASMEKNGYILIYESSVTAPNFLDISETKIVYLNHLHPASAVNLLAPQLHEYVSSDDALKTNQLSITAPPNIMERILSDLKKIDLPSRQVLLDVRIVIIEGQQLLNMGITWEWPQITSGAFGGAAASGWPWQVQVGYTPSSEFTNALNLTLELLSQNDQATVLANPQVMSIDGEEAQIRVIREEYFEILTQGFYTSSQLEKVEAGTSLQITPKISANNEITMQITTEVSDVISRGANSLPVVTRRSASSRVRVENGGTAAIAGLVDNRAASARINVPGFSAIPLVGAAFKDRRNQQTSRQVAIFVSPTIVSDQDEFVSTSTKSYHTHPTITDESFTEQVKQLLKNNKDAVEKDNDKPISG